MDFCRVALLTFGRSLFCHHYVVACIAVKNRYLMTPPELAGDTPIVDVIEPIEIDTCPSFWSEMDSAFLRGFNGRFCQRLHLDEPLIRQTRFDNRFTTIA